MGNNISKQVELMTQEYSPLYELLLAGYPCAEKFPSFSLCLQ